MCISPGIPGYIIEIIEIILYTVFHLKSRCLDVVKCGYNVFRKKEAYYG
jgi:hypothetical protein